MKDTNYLKRRYNHYIKDGVNPFASFDLAFMDTTIRIVERNMKNATRKN